MTLVNTIFDALLTPLAATGRGWALTVFSVVTGVALLLLFKVASNPERVATARNRAIARVLELWLFQSDPLVSLGALGRVLRANAVYLGTLLRPVLLSAVPMVLLLAQAHDWFAGRPLAVGETALVVAHWRPSEPLPESTLTAGTGLVVETPAVRSAARHETAWRIRRDAPTGSPAGLTLTAPGLAEVRLAVAAAPGRCTPKRVLGRWAHLLYPGQPRLPADGPLTELEVRYPAAEYGWGRWQTDWLIALLVVSLLTGLALKGPLGVEF